MTSISYLLPGAMVQGRWSEVSQSTIVENLYQSWHHVNWQDTYFVLHLPYIGGCDNISIPPSTKRIVLTCHVEPIDIDWVRRLAVERPDAEICVLFDGLYAPPSAYYPPNIRIYSWLSWHFQLDRMFKVFGHRPNITRPKFWASSLCNRSAQFKLYVTAYCVHKGYHDRMLISYHGIVDKISDINHLKTGHPLLDHLADIVDRLPIIKIDDTSRQDRDLPSINNRNWNFPQHTECLFNFTNEGFHYSKRMTENGTVIWPGPDLSEKTLKPLLAGQAILPVGQWRTVAALRDLGFRFDYGLNLDYDDIPGDINRMLACLTVINNIMSTPLEDLFDATRESSMHNANWAISFDFAKKCNDINENSLVQLCQQLSI